MADVFPPSWYVPAMKDRVIDWLKWQGIEAERVKFAYTEWCARAGVRVRKEDVERLLGRSEGRV